MPALIELVQTVDNLALQSDLLELSEGNPLRCDVGCTPALSVGRLSMGELEQR